MTETIDIYSKSPYPSCELSNFAEHPFVFDGVECASMEGFLQSLKYHTKRKQRKICALTGKTAKKAGRRRVLWYFMREAYWQGKRYDRLSPEFRALVMRAYRAMYEQNEAFRTALDGTRGKRLCHTIGTKNPKMTILTEREFICCLYRLRDGK